MIAFGEENRLGPLRGNDGRRHDELKPLGVEPGKNTRPLLIDELVTGPSDAPRKLRQALNVEAIVRAIGLGDDVWRVADVGSGNKWPGFGTGLDDGKACNDQSGQRNTRQNPGTNDRGAAQCEHRKLLLVLGHCRNEAHPGTVRMTSFFVMGRVPVNTSLRICGRNARLLAR